MSVRDSIVAMYPHEGGGVVALCGYSIAYGPDWHEEPCDRPAPSWRWYQDVEHEDCLERACLLHENRGGVRMAKMRSALLAVLDLRDEIRERSPESIRSHLMDDIHSMIGIHLLSGDPS